MLARTTDRKTRFCCSVLVIFLHACAQDDSVATDVAVDTNLQGGVKSSDKKRVKVFQDALEKHMRVDIDLKLKGSDASTTTYFLNADLPFIRPYVKGEWVGKLGNRLTYDEAYELAANLAEGLANNLADLGFKAVETPMGLSHPLFQIAQKLYPICGLPGKEGYKPSTVVPSRNLDIYLLLVSRNSPFHQPKWTYSCDEAYKVWFVQRASLGAININPSVANEIAKQDDTGGCQ